MEIQSDVPVSIVIDVEELPHNWSAWRSFTGQIFYYNGNTSMFTWELPRKSSAPTRNRSKRQR
jgi:hypothetical protein